MRPVEPLPEMTLGCVDISTKPNESADKAQEAKIALSELVKTRKDTTIMLDFVHKTFDQMPFTIAPGIVVSRLLTVGSGWNNRLGATVENKIDEVIGIIAPIRQDILANKVTHQRNGLGDVMALSSRQAQTQRIAQRVYAGVDFGAETAPRTSKPLSGLSSSFFAAPAAHGWARITVLSTSTFSKSGSSAKWLSICSHTPWSHQRAKRLYTLFHLPYALGNSRHCAPLRLTHSTPSTKRRHALADPTYTCRQLRRNSSIFFHCSSFSFISLMRLILPQMSTQPSSDQAAQICCFAANQPGIFGANLVQRQNKIGHGSPPG